jgi:hypothetical protein
MNRHLFSEFNQVFNKGDSFCILLVLEQKKPAFYDYKGLDGHRYKKLIKIIERIKLSFPYINLYTHRDNNYKCVIYDNTLNSLEDVQEVYKYPPRTKDEVEIKIKKEAKLLGYPTVLLDTTKIRNIRSGPAALKWYYITYILAEGERNISEVYSFFCRYEYFNHVKKEALKKKEEYNLIAKKLHYNILLCLEEHIYNRKIY